MILYHRLLAAVFADNLKQFFNPAAAALMRSRPLRERSAGPGSRRLIPPTDTSYSEEHLIKKSSYFVSRRQGMGGMAKLKLSLKVKK